MTTAAFVVLDAAAFGPLRHYPGRTALAILAIALGIALGLSIYLINRAAADEIEAAARSLYGVADLAIEEEGEGFDESLYPQIARTQGVAETSPAVEVEAKLADRRGALTLIGVDVFRYARLQPAFVTNAGGGEISLELLDPQAVFLSSSAAKELGLSAGDELSVQVGIETEAFKVAGILPPAALRERAGLVDIATAQWMFDRLGKLSRVSVRLSSGAAHSEVRAALEALATGPIRVTTPGEATDEALSLSRAYRANLTALALVALFTGGFFVYSTQALAALRRRREFAVLHAIGMTRRQQLVLTLLASSAVGLLGSLLGIALGLALAKLGVQLLGAGIGAGYYSDLAPQLHVRGVEIAGFCLLGVVVALAGAARPALESSRIPTASALKAGDIASARLPSHTGAIVTLFALSALVLLVPPIAGLPLPGYVSIAFLLIGTVAAMPLLIRATLRILPSTTRVPYEVAIAELSGTARYAALSVSAIVVSFSLMVAMAIMVTSFRTSLDAWTQKILPADVYLRVGYVGQSAYLQEDVLNELAAMDGIARTESSRFSRAVLDKNRPPLVLIARTFDTADIEASLWITERTSGKPLAGEVPVWMSEAAADLFALQAGDDVELTVEGRSTKAYVQGLWRDYEHQNGAVIMDRAAYVRITGDRAINTVWMWLREGASAQSLRAALREKLPESINYDIREPRELRALSLRVFDRTFAITYVLELVAVAIGLFGIAAGISAQVLSRRGELGALRHIGFTKAQVGTMLAIEGAVLGALGVLVGLVNGAIVSLILIYVVNRQSFHWSMDLHAPGLLLSALAILLVGASASIAVLSGRRAMSADVVQAVKEDW